MPWLWNLWLERCGHILDTVRMLVGTAPVTVRAHPAWVRSHDLAAGIGSHHACGRMGVLRCWADSDSAPRGRSRPPLREDGKAGPRAGLSRPGQPRRQPDASRINVLAVPSLNWARAHEIGSRTTSGRSSARDRWLNSCWTPFATARRSRPRGTSLERLSGWIRT